MPDDRRLVAFLCGPLVLAAKTDEELVLEVDDAAQAVSLLRPVGGPTTTTFLARLASGSEVTLVPVNQIVGEEYGVYFRCRNAIGF